jgi:TonB family protein
MGIEGRVVVEVTVDAQGRPIQANIVESTSDIFDESATEAALKTTYKPAIMTTGPVTAKVRVTFDFQLKR